MHRRGFAAVVVFALLVAALLIQAPAATGVSATIVISQVYGGGGNSGATLKNDFIELFNRGSVSVDVTGWTVQYASSSGTTWQTTALSGMIPPGGYYLVQQAAGAGGTTNLPTPDAVGSIAMSATTAKVAVVNTSTALAGACPISAVIIDFLGYGNANCSEGTPTPALSNTTAAQRNNGGCADTDNNVADFTVGAPNPRNSASPAQACGTGPAGTGAANPNTVAPGGNTLLTVAVTPGTGPASTGLGVTADLSAIGEPASQMFFDNGSNGDATAGDNTFSFLATVDPATALGPKSLPATITDAEMRSANATIDLTVVAPTEVVISEFRVRGPNGGNDEFIELYNRTASPVNVGGWKIRGSNASGTIGDRATLSAGATIGPGCYYLLTNSGTSGGPYSGMVPGDQTYSTGVTDTGGVALTRPDNSIVDQVGLDAGSAFKEGTPLTSLGSSNLNRGYERRPGGTLGSGQDTNDNSADFQLLTPSDPQNSMSPCIPITTTSVPFGVGNANPDLLTPGENTLLTVAVTPGMNPTSTGLMVQGDLTSIGGAAMQSFFDDATNGDATAGDNVFTFAATVPTGTAPGDKNIPVMIADAQSRSSNTSIQFVVLASLAINEIQGTGVTSPYVGLLVRTSGIVIGRKVNGFFIQTPDGSSGDDGNPMTSEGLFVFTGGAPPAEAAVHNRVNVTGMVSEFIPASDPGTLPLTELVGDPFVAVTVLEMGAPLPAAVTLTATDTSPAGMPGQLERFEGMRVHVDSLTAVGPTDGNVSESTATGFSNGLFFGVISGVARPFREPGIDQQDVLPPGTPPGVPVYDGNPERLRIDSDAIGAPALDVTSGAVVTNLTGPLDWGFRTWSILPDPEVPVGVSGIGAAMPLPPAGINEFTVASFNLERFFDTVNDPGISDPVLNAAAFDRRLGKASLAIRVVMGLPDIIGVEEMENLSTLQALADRINADAMAAGLANPNYQPYLEEGNDIGGIDVGFLAKNARVAVIDVTQPGKDATYINPNNGMPELLNDRPPLVLRAQILAPLTPPFPVTVIVNHLRSLIDINDPADGNRVRHKRRAQAEFLASLIQQHQTDDPNASIISVGDYNAFQFNDGYVDVVGIVKGTPAPADQVILAGSDLVDPDLTDLADLIEPEQRYSYVQDGSAQVLDHVLVNSDLMTRFSRFHYGRVDADFPEVFRTDGSRPERISDHDPAVAYFFLPPLPVAIDIKPGTFPNPINLGSNGTIPVAILSTADFDAGQVDPTTVTLASAPVKLKGQGTPMASLEDVNGDGRRDLLLHISTPALQLTSADVQAVLEGMTYDGRRIRGVDSIRVVP